jgi:serine protease
MKSLYLSIAAVLAIGMAGGAQSAVITTFMSPNVPVAICDLCTVTSSLDVAGHGRVLDVNALLDITHSYDADLVLSLSHAGKTVLLSNRQGGSGGADYTNTVFDDSAQFSIAAGSVYAPYEGSFRPQQALSAFFYQDVFGLWTLTVTDSEAGDDGVINRFGITAAVPEPGSLALFGLGLLGMVARVGSRRKA